MISSNPSLGFDLHPCAVTESESVKLKHHWLQPLHRWLSSREVHRPRSARWLCKLIPAQCPFERDIQIGAWHWHIPPLCKLNPFYEDLMLLRFRALSFLADECGEDVTPYCR